MLHGIAALRFALSAVQRVSTLTLAYRYHTPRRGRRLEFGICVLALALLGLPELLYGHTSSAGGAPGWSWRWDVIVVLSIAAAVYVRGWLFLRRSSSRTASFWRLGSYAVGIGALAAALLSPVDGLASERLSLHMVQHVLILMIAPLAILMAEPFAPFLWGMPPPLRRPFARLFGPHTNFRSAARLLTSLPVAWSLYVLNLWGWHHPALYQAALEHQWIHDLEHWLFFLTAVLFWWPIANVPPMLHGQISLAYRVVYLVAATLQNTLLGMAISLPERVLYPFYALAPSLEALSPIHDQALGGGIMWVSGHMYLIPIVVLIGKKLSAEDEAMNRASAVVLAPRVQRRAAEGS